MRKNTFGDCLIAGGIAVIGMAEAWHLAAVFLKLAFTDCARLIAVSLSILLVLGTGFLIAGRKRIFAKDGRKTSTGVRGQLFYAAFVLMAVAQLIFVGIGNATYRSGDMMVETVESFLVSDGIYQVNPMTGMPYAEGMPLRLKILCLIRVIFVRAAVRRDGAEACAGDSDPGSHGRAAELLCIFFGAGQDAVSGG